MPTNKTPDAPTCVLNRKRKCMAEVIRRLTEHTMADEGARREQTLSILNAVNQVLSEVKLSRETVHSLVIRMDKLEARITKLEKRS